MEVNVYMNAIKINDDSADILDFNNGSIHILDPVTFEQGFTAGDVDELRKSDQHKRGGIKELEKVTC